MDLSLGRLTGGVNLPRTHEHSGGAERGPTGQLAAVSALAVAVDHEPPEVTPCEAAGAGAGCGAVAGGESGAGAVVDVGAVVVVDAGWGFAAGRRPGWWDR
jgi:hypothetical protein